MCRRRPGHPERVLQRLGGESEQPALVPLQRGAPELLQLLARAQTVRASLFPGESILSGVVCNSFDTPKIDNVTLDDLHRILWTMRRSEQLTHICTRMYDYFLLA